MTLWLGVDVGATRKGFDVALIDDRSLLELRGRLTVADVVRIADTRAPLVVAIDSPRSCAPAGHTARPSERALNRAVCRFAALAARGHHTIEVFPTASWTRWCGPRGTVSRAQWSRAGLTQLGLLDLPERSNQDQRDAIAAAVTAREHTHGLTEAIGEIVIPTT